MLTDYVIEQIGLDVEPTLSVGRPTLSFWEVEINRDRGKMVFMSKHSSPRARKSTGKKSHLAGAEEQSARCPRETGGTGTEV